MECIPADPILEFNPTTLEDTRKCWNLDNGRMKQSVDILEHWMKKQNHFMNKNFSRVYLELTLVTCKGSVEKAKSRIDKLCTFKTLLPKFFIGGEVRKTLKEVSDIACMIPLPKLTKDHMRPVIVKITDKDFTSAQFMNWFQLIVVVCEYLKAHDYNNGFIFIEDMRDANLMDIITKINLVELQQCMTMLIEGYGARLQGIHLITQSKVIDLFVKLFKSALSPKLAARIKVHQDESELHSIVEKEILPIEYGGNERSIEKLKNEWFDILSSEEYEKHLAVMKASCTDESLRSSGTYNEQIMGLPGSFRTLSVD